MEFFGLTYCGPQNYVRDIMKSDYHEPKNKDESDELLKKISQLECNNTFQRPPVDRITVIDCYIGRVHGFAYGSIDKFDKMKKKGVIKPIGPSDMYRFPPVTSTDFSWWLCDPALVNADWTKTSPRFPAPVSPNVLVLDHARKCNKYATLF